MNVLVVALEEIEKKLVEVVFMPCDDETRANERLSLLIRRQMQFLTDHPGLATLLFTHRLYTVDIELKPSVQRIMERYIPYLEEIILQGIEEKIFSPRGEVNECATLVSALMNGLVFQCFLYNSMKTLQGYTQTVIEHSLAAVGYRTDNR